MIAASPAVAGGGVDRRWRATRFWRLIVPVLLYFVLFYGLSDVGMLGPDEPRYASIGREMARSGDWITPRLWGEAWFEKPVLLYWMTAAGFKLGLGDELAPRLPVALASAVFLLFYVWALGREFGRRAALFSTGILATSAAWLGFSHVAVTDLPMSAAFSAAMLLCLGWVDRGDRRMLVPAAALFGAAVLGKGLVPLALALPLAWMGRKRLLDWFKPGPVAAFLLVAAPWYLVCFARNGMPFVEEFFLKHHLSRFADNALQHQQPFWFYAPVLLGGLFPWTPLAALLFRRPADPRRIFLLLWLAFGFVFFSASTNKLPGYLLPLFPAACALIGIGLDEVKRARWLLPLPCLMLLAVPAVPTILPQALARGITHAEVGAAPWFLALPILGVAVFAWKTRREWAFAAALLTTAAALVWVKVETFPMLDHAVSARSLWREVAPRAEETCVGPIHRSWRYGLNYYSVEPLPDCAESPRPWRITGTGSSRPDFRSR